MRCDAISPPSGPSPYPITDGWNPKGYASRTIPITADTHAAFIGFLDGKAMLPRHKKNFWSAMTEACDEAGVLRATPHDLRRT